MANYKRREVFLMSLEEERKILFPIYYLYYEIQRAHAADIITQENIEEIRAQKKKELIQALRASKVNLEKATELANRLKTSKWYSVYIPNTQAAEDIQPLTEDSAVYALTMSNNPSEATLLTIKDYPDFYNTINDEKALSTLRSWVHIRASLKIPKDYVNINAGALEVLLAILDLSTEGSTELIPQLPAIFSTKVSTVEFPLDKLNNNIWRRDSKEIDGQFSLEVEMGKKGEGAIVCYSIDFEALEKDLQISKNLEPYDKRVYMAINAIYNSREEKVDCMSITQIYTAMGIGDRPSATDIEKINNSITKMSKAHVTVDNLEETTKHKRQTRFSYDAPLLPCERIQGYVNGQLSEGILHIFREPPVMSFAKAHGQLTTITPALLQSPINKTRSNILLEDYLIDRIAKIKSGHSPKKILLSTVYENTEIISIKQKQRATEKIEKILDHFRKNGFIKSYKMDKISIVVEI